MERRLNDIESIGIAANNATIVFGSLAQGILSIAGAFNRVPDKVDNPIQQRETSQSEEDKE